MTKEILIPKEKQQKLEEGRKNFQELWKKIKPFVKERKPKEYSTTGKWCTFDYDGQI